MLSAERLAALGSGLRGDLVRPGDPSYEQLRRVYNGMIDRRPGAIARCRDVADVITAVDAARENEWTLAIRGGGHNGPGFGVCDDGLVVDLSFMRGIRVDPEARTARVETGCVWGDVDHATHAFGLAAVSGINSTTGVSGLTLGGGHGYLTRKYGLTIDNLLSADLVLADGSFVTASEAENSDLFWALRGGGGNFGVATSFLFRLHPVHTVYGGPMLWPIEKTAELLAWYRDFIADAPEDFYGFFMTLTVPPAPMFPAKLHGKKACGVIWCHVGPLEEAERALEPARRFGPPLVDRTGPLPFPYLQSAFDSFYPAGMQWYWRGDFVRELSDEAIQIHVDYANRLPTPLSTMHLYPVDGAVHSKRSDATPFRFRDARWSMVIVGVDPDPANAGLIRNWTTQYWEDLHEHSAGGAYVNFLMDEGTDRVRATYGENYVRLAEIKARYDPSNIFRVNQNILPAGA